MEEKGRKMFDSKEYYREKIIEMVVEINDMADLELIYGMTLSAYKDIKAAEEK